MEEKKIEKNKKELRDENPFRKSSKVVLFPLKLPACFVFVLFLNGVLTRPDDWPSKNPGKNKNFDRLTEWMSKGAKPKKEFFMPKSGEKSLRKEYRTLAKGEREQFHRCLLSLKHRSALGSNLTEYETFVIHHTYDYAPEAHDGPTFLLFHRVFLYVLERLMRSQKGCHDTALHYWDTTLDAMLPDPSDTVIFNHPHFVGNKNGTVTTGFMSSWGRVVPENCHKYGVNLTRSVCNIQYALLLNQEVDAFVHCGAFEQCVFPNNRRFEDAHGQVHNCVGGHMSDLMCAPNDPVFFMYHSFIDLIFQQYIDYNYPRKYGFNPAEDYPKNPEKVFWRADSDMFPFTEFKVIDGLSRNFSDHLVAYEPRPRRCSSHSDCTKGRSDTLWCDVRVSQCMAKVYVSGSCEGYPSEACYNGCGLNEEVMCDKTTYKCLCKLAFCSKDEECVEKNELCDLTTRKCTKQKDIGGFCGKLPDSFCRGTCYSPNEVLKCYQGVCSCRLNAIRCDVFSPTCPRFFYCAGTGLCRPQVSRGEACEEDKECKPTCYQGYIARCSRKSLVCRCFLKSKLKYLVASTTTTLLNEVNPLSKPTSNGVEKCVKEEDCSDARHLCLWTQSFLWTVKRCFYVRCGVDKDCGKKGIARAICKFGYCVRIATRMGFEG